MQKAAYEQLAQVHLANLQQIGIPGSYELTMPEPGSTKAVGNLLAMGLDVVPILTEALDDTAVTKTVERTGNWPKYEIRVNQIVVRLIERISSHRFTIGEEPKLLFIDEISAKPELTPQFQKAILDWYKVNRERSQVERKLADVDDPHIQNRLEAVALAASRKEVKAAPSMRKFITMVDGYGGEECKVACKCAFALGQIGDKESLPAVRKLCQQLPAYGDVDHKPLGAAVMEELFQACHGLALLGEKTAALKKLNRIYEVYRPEMGAALSGEFKKRLDEAEKW